jgi:hypothetical protein
VERDIPRLLALLSFTIDRLEAYASVSTPEAQPAATFFQGLSDEIQAMLQQTEIATDSEDQSRSEESNPEQQSE